MVDFFSNGFFEDLNPVVKIEKKEKPKLTLNQIKNKKFIEIQTRAADALFLSTDVFVNEKYEFQQQNDTIEHSSYKSYPSTNEFFLGSETLDMNDVDKIFGLDNLEFSKTKEIKTQKVKKLKTKFEKKIKKGNKKQKDESPRKSPNLKLSSVPPQSVDLDNYAQKVCTRSITKKYLKEIDYSLQELKQKNNLAIFELHNILRNKSLLDHGSLYHLINNYQVIKSLANYLKTDYEGTDFSSPLYYLKHKKHGKHLLFGTNVATQVEDFSLLCDMHPIFQEVQKRKIKTIICVNEDPSKIESEILKHLMDKIENCKCTYLYPEDNGELMKLKRKYVDEQENLFTSFINRRSTSMLPGRQMIFINQWGKVCKHLVKALDAAYMCGEVKLYYILFGLFWSLVKYFDEENECLKVLKTIQVKVSTLIEQKLLTHLQKSNRSLILCEMSGLATKNGVVSLLRKNGWKVESIKNVDVTEYRIRKNSIHQMMHHKCKKSQGSLQHEVEKTGMHAKKLISWNKSE